MDTTGTTKLAPHENPKILGIAGFTLFILGILSFALVYARGDASPETVRLAAGTAILMGMGYPAMLHADTKKRLAALEARLAARESPPN